jgi:hypothetical protein
MAIGATLSRRQSGAAKSLARFCYLVGAKLYRRLGLTGFQLFDEIVEKP